MTISTKLIGSLSDIDPKTWNAWVGDQSYYLSHEWLLMQESDTEARSQYLIASHEGRPVGGLPLYVPLNEKHPSYRPESLADGRWSGRYLLAGARRGHANGLLLSGRLDSLLRRRVLGILLESASELASAHGMDGLLFLYLPSEPAHCISDSLNGRTPLLLAQEATIALPGETQEDYWYSLPLKQRKKCAREIARFRRAGYEVARERLSQCWDEAGPLFSNLQRKYGREDDPQRWLGLLKRQAASAADDRSVVFTCRRSGELLGFALGYEWKDAVFLRVAGFDYARLSGSFEYFNLAYYQPLAYAYSKGLRSLQLGRGSFDAKLRRGAALSPLWGLEVSSSRAHVVDPVAEAATRTFNRKVHTEWAQEHHQDPRDVDLKWVS